MPIPDDPVAAEQRGVAAILDEDPRAGVVQDRVVFEEAVEAGGDDVDAGAPVSFAEAIPHDHVFLLVEREAILEVAARDAILDEDALAGLQVDGAVRVEAVAHAVAHHHAPHDAVVDLGVETVLLFGILDVLPLMGTVAVDFELLDRGVVDDAPVERNVVPFEAKDTGLLLHRGRAIDEAD